MSKPLVKVNTTIRIDNNPVQSWELLSFGECPIMHAAWNPQARVLICQYDSVKESIESIPVFNKKTKKVDYEQKRVDAYYRVTVEDKEGIKFILDNLVSNYKGEEFDIVYTPSQVDANTEELKAESV
jgi:hypothetical protein